MRFLVKKAFSPYNTVKKSGRKALFTSIVKAHFISALTGSTQGAVNFLFIIINNSSKSNAPFRGKKQILYIKDI